MLGIGPALPFIQYNNNRVFVPRSCLINWLFMKHQGVSDIILCGLCVVRQNMLWWPGSMKCFGLLVVYVWIVHSTMTLLCSYVHVHAPCTSRKVLHVLQIVLMSTQCTAVRHWVVCWISKFLAAILCTLPNYWQYTPNALLLVHIMKQQC